MGDGVKNADPYGRVHHGKAPPRRRLNVVALLARIAIFVFALLTDAALVLLLWWVWAERPFTDGSGAATGVTMLAVGLAAFVQVVHHHNSTSPMWRRGVSGLLIASCRTVLRAAEDDLWRES